ncbi:MAG: hypothetical protein Q4D26_10880 [Clostridia bacterium]|nr:hypothetical protein [Clostridia bacterium]
MIKYCKPSIEIISFKNEDINMALVSGNYNSANFKNSNNINNLKF